MRADEGASTGAAAGRIADAAAERAGSERWTYLAIAAVGAAFWALPVALSSSIQLDDAELVTIVQGWRLSYDTSQPPLYGWIHQAVSSVLGVSMASTQFVRLALLVLLFAAVYRLGRRITVHAASQYVLLAGYVFFPIISWEGTHYQTHTVLLNLMTVALFLIVVEIRKAPDTGKFLLLGAICGLGLLSKYTFVAILGSVFVATLSVREYRAALLRPAAALSFLVMLMIAVPPTLATVWGLGEVSDFPNVTQEVTNPNVDFASRSLTGAVKLAEQYATQSLLFVAMVALVWGSAARRIDFRKAGRNPDFRFFAVQAVTAFLIVLAVVVAFGIDGISSHHPASLLLSLPIVAVLALDASSLLAGGESLWRKRLFVGAAAACVIAIWAILALSLVYVFPGRFPSYAPLARAIEGAAGAEAAVIAESYSIGGPLRARQSRFTVNAANLATRVPVQNPPRPVPCVAVWWEQGDGAPPASLVGYVEHLTGNAWRNPGIDSTLVRGAGESRPERADLRFEILPASAACAAPSGSAG